MKLNKFFRQALMCLFTLTISAAVGADLALAQTIDTATVRGSVVDQNKAAVPGARITLVNQSTGLERDAVTDDGGRFTIANVPLTGKYEITAAGQGFAEQKRGAIQFRANEAAIFDFTLFPEANRSEVTVLGTTDAVQSDSSQLATRFDLQ
jgi:hypothetical protein